MIKKKKRKEIIFIIVFLATILYERLLLFFLSENNWRWYDKLHHLYYGIILFSLLIIFNKKWRHHLIIPFAFGLGWIADELIFLLPFFYGDGSKAYYFGLPSIFGAIIMTALVIIFRKKIIKEIEKISNI